MASPRGEAGPGRSSRPLLFYSAWPLGYHNQEAERKAAHFAEAGYRVVYVAGIGYRNPDLSNVPKLVDRLGRKLRQPAGDRVRTARHGLGSASLLVVPPRQRPRLRRLNARWVERQVRRAVSPVETAVAWIRSPTPELVDALPRLRPAATVYEAVDAYWLTPGIVGRWREILEDTERAMVRHADLVVVPSAALAERYESLGATVRLVPHGTDLFPPAERKEARGRPVTLGFVGTLDQRLDTAIVRHLAVERPAWRVRLIGPVQAGFDAEDYADLPNVAIEPPVPVAALGQTLAELDVGLMPYFDDPFYRYMCPVKNLEYLAAGLPAVARPSPALELYGDVLYFAGSPAEFLGQVERALSEDGPEQALARRRVAEAGSWQRRLEELDAALEHALERSASPLWATAP
jgi:glycosyltransferase involved in cell wall biosynthesis